MGKAADNEREKLKATFFNNIGAGLILTGFLVPYLGVVGKLGTFAARFRTLEWPTFEEQANGVAILIAMGLAFASGRDFRRRADQIASEIEGD